MLVFCKTPELIEGYAEKIANPNVRYDCHHRLETHFSDGTERPINSQITRNELKALGMYYNRPAEELVYLPQQEHMSLHGYKRIHTENEKQKISDGVMKRYVMCIETGEVHYISEWRRLGYGDTCKVARGLLPTCKGLHFKYVEAS